MNSQKPGINRYLKYLYSKIENSLIGNKIIEVGSGAGLSVHFIKKHSITLTDVMDWPQGKVQGSIDATNLPYPDNSFDTLFALDAIHHMEFPVRALAEACRVVVPGGRVVIIEPFVSYFSFLIYKIFHNEQTTWNYKISSDGSVTSNIASEGEQSTLQSIISDDKWVRSIKEFSKKEIKIHRSYFSPFSFFATGGLSNPLPIPAFLIAIIISFEKILSEKILYFISARQMLVIEVY
jgi:ubiquinone/menaquinone biosynthesis C-methylase UbiE